MSVGTPKAMTQSKASDSLSFMSSAIASPSIKSDQHYNSRPTPYSSSYCDNVLMTEQSASKEPVTAFRDISDSTLSPASPQSSSIDFALPFTRTSPLSSSTNSSIEQLYSTTLSSSWFSNASKTNGVTQASVEKDGN